MVSLVKLGFRVAHIIGGIILVSLNVASLSRGDADVAAKKLNLNCGNLFGKFSFHFTMAVESVCVLVLFAGLANSMLLKPSSSMKNTKLSLNVWRFFIYGVKGFLWIASTSLINILISGLFKGSSIDVDRTAAFVKICALLFASFVGSFCRYWREDAIAQSAIIEKTKEK